MNINYFKEAEKVLKSRKDLAVAEQIISARIKAIEMRSAPHEVTATQYDKPYTDAKMVNDSLTSCLELIAETARLKETRATLAEIDGALSHMDESEKKLLDLWYAQSWTKEDIAYEMGNLALKSLYAQRNKSVARFALLYFGAGALAAM